MRRRRHWGRNDPDLPPIVKLTGPVVGAKLLGARVREEGVIAHGAFSERWRLTDDINGLLMGDHEFVMGTSLREVKELLEIRHPSPVPGTSMIEVCNSDELKRHTMPFGHPVLITVRKNPEYEQRKWGDKYITTYLPGPVAILTQLCMGGNDLLVSTEVADHIRSDDDFYASDLVIGTRDTWYSLVKYRPGKAQARRKTKATITAKDTHANELVVAGRDLRCAAADAYISLRKELDKFEIDRVLVHVTDPNRKSYYRGNYDDKDTLAVVRQVRELLLIHAALLGKHAYRYNDAWHEFLLTVRCRPKDLDDDTWGNYADVRGWLAAECKIKKPKPTKKMIAAKAAAEAADRKAKTCVGCGEVKEHAYELYGPPRDRGETGYAPDARICSDCWEAKFDAGAEQLLSTAAVV